MPQVIENSSIKVTEPVVVLPLAKWQEIEDILDDYECLIRYNEAINDPGNQERIPFGKVKKELNLP